jgi:hypothetical protein
MEAEFVTETLVSTYKFSRRYNPEDQEWHSYNVLPGNGLNIRKHSPLNKRNFDLKKMQFLWNGGYIV